MDPDRVSAEPPLQQPPIPRRVTKPQTGQGLKKAEPSLALLRLLPEPLAAFRLPLRSLPITSAPSYNQVK